MVNKRNTARLRSRSKKATQGVQSKTRAAVRQLDFESESSEDDHEMAKNGVGPESESDKENRPQWLCTPNNQLQDLVVTLFDISDKLLDFCKGETVFADGERLDVNLASLTRILRAANEKVIEIDSASDSRDERSDSKHENLSSPSRNTGRTRNRRIPPKQFYSKLSTGESTGDESSSTQYSDQDEESITGRGSQSPRKRPMARVTTVSSEEEDSTEESETSESEVETDETYSSSDTESSVSPVKMRWVRVSSTESESSGNSELEEDSDDNLNWHPKEDNRWDTRKRKISLRKRSESSREKVAKMCEDTDEETDEDSSN